jgi:ABC-type glycerol-3-phosphate transport system permease component
MTARIEELPTRTVRPARRGPRASTREAGWGFFLISPWIVGLLVLTAIPIIASLLLSFTNYDILHPDRIRWVGLDNYAWAASDPTTLSSAFLTLKFAAVSVPLAIAVALAIALLVNNRLLVGKRAFRTLFFLPVQIPVTASVFIWLGFISGANRMPVAWLQSTSTSIAQTLSHLPLFSTLATVYPTGWFTDRSWTLPWLILMSVWGVGNMTLIFLAGLQTVPAVLYDAARADGASAWRTFRHVTLPMISPMVFYNLILSIIGVAGYFTQAYLWSLNTRGGGGQSNVWNLNLYTTGWDFNAMGRACALAWLLFVVVIVISVLLFWTARRWVYYAGADATTSKATSPETETALFETELAPAAAIQPATAGEGEPAPADTEPAPAEIETAQAAAVQPATAGEPAPAETEPAAVMTAPRRRPARRRSKLNRFMRKLTSRTAFTVVTAVLCGMFLLPFLYALSGAFGAPSAGAGRGAPLYPATARTYQCTDSQLCTYRLMARDRASGKFTQSGPSIDASQQQDPTLPVYVVPGYGNLALLEDLSVYGQPSVFIDPAANKQVDVSTTPGRLSRVWDFHISLDNFATALDWAGKITPTGLGGIATWLVNSATIAIFSTIGAVLSCVVVAYGFARFRFPGRDLLFLILIGSVLVPYQVTLIPQFILYRALGLTSGFLPLILPNFFGNALYIFLLRQFFMALPRDLDEAAMVDGAGHLRILRSVIVPQALPAIIAVGLFQFFFSWSDFFGPLIYLSGNSDRYPLSLGVNYFTFNLQQGGTNGPGILEAGSFLVLIVPVVIFFVAQRFFMRGIVLSGVEK